MGENKGHVHIVAMMVLFLALVGFLHLYGSFKEERLREELLKAINDGKKLADDFIKDREQRSGIDETYHKTVRTIKESSDNAADEALIRKIIGSIKEIAEQNQKRWEEP